MPFDAALVKGMGNYLCLDRLTEEQAFQQIVQNPAFASMERLLGDFAEWNGDLDLLADSLPRDTRSRVAADSDFCAWRECPHFGPCYVREMRDRSRRAQIIVVNHTLLLLDAAMEGFLLPERDVIVIDEAHHRRRGDARLHHHRLAEPCHQPAGTTSAARQLRATHLSGGAVCVLTGVGRIGACRSARRQRTPAPHPAAGRGATSRLGHQQRGDEPATRAPALA
jgi:hypothetical protein